MDQEQTKEYFNLIRKFISEIKESDSNMEKNIKLDALSARFKLSGYKIPDNPDSKSHIVYCTTSAYCSSYLKYAVTLNNAL